MKISVAQMEEKVKAMIARGERLHGDMRAIADNMYLREMEKETEKQQGDK